MGRNFGVNEHPTEWYSAEDVETAMRFNFIAGIVTGLILTHVGWLVAFWALGWI